VTKPQEACEDAMIPLSPDSLKRLTYTGNTQVAGRRHSAYQKRLRPQERSASQANRS